MAAYLIRRLLLMLVTLLGISIVIFTLLRVVPGNIADILFSASGMINPEDKLDIERQLGLDQPIYSRIEISRQLTPHASTATRPRVDAVGVHVQRL